MSELSRQGPGWRPADSLSRVVIDAVAEHEGVEPSELEPPLYHAVDPEALDALFPDTGRSGSTGRVRFSYDGRDVCVTSDGQVQIAEADEE